MKNKIWIICFVSCIVGFGSCKKEESEPAPMPLPPFTNTIPEFYKPNVESKYGLVAPDFVLVANSSSKLSIPQDLDFHPSRANEMWIVNKETENSGGTTIIIKDAGLPTQSSLFRKDGNAWHFMSLPSGLAFSTNGNWASSANVLDANHGNGKYTGPALWSSDLSIFAQPSGGNGSHLDMVHQSPYTMGIAAEKDNVFWVFDGYYKNIVRYDFAADHGPGNDYHGDARLRRYSEVTVMRDPTVPSHLILDKDSKWLYIVDGGNKRILRMDITTGTVAGNLPPVGEALAEYVRMTGVTWEVFTDLNLQKPSGIDIMGNRLFVSDYQTGEIICYDVKTKEELARINTGKAGITGIKIYKGNIWYVNALENTCYVVKQNR